MIKGINNTEEEIIKKILAEYPYKFYFYGSRVKGGFTRGSDLDILILADRELPAGELERLDTEFNKSKIPYRVNFSQRITMDENFYKLIENSLVEVDKWFIFSMEKKILTLI